MKVCIAWACYSFVALPGPTQLVSATVTRYSEAGSPFVGGFFLSFFVPPILTVFYLIYLCDKEQKKERLRRRLMKVREACYKLAWPSGGCRISERGCQGKVASAKREQNFVTPPQQLVIDHVDYRACAY